MSHEKNCVCGCDNADIQKNTQTTPPIQITENQKAFLLQLNHHKFMPVARFTIADSKEPDFLITALAPVFIQSIGDEMPTLKQTAAFLQQLEDADLLTLDYDMPLNSYEYAEYKTSEIYKYFCDTVAQGATKPGYLGDTPVLELGSMALTDKGEKIIDGSSETNNKNQKKQILGYKSIAKIYKL